MRSTPYDYSTFLYVFSSSFNPRLSCIGRRYKYFLPICALPIKMIENLDNSKAEKISTIIQEKLQIFVGNLNFHNFTKNAAGQVKSKKIIKLLKEEKVFKSYEDIDIASYKSKINIKSTSYNLEDLVNESIWHYLLIMF